MRILFLTTEIGGHGGIQYAGRLFVRAMGDVFPGCSVTVVSILDPSGALETASGTYEIRGGAGSRFQAARIGYSELRRSDWDLVVLGHVNLAPLLLLHRPVSVPVTGWIYGVEAWHPLSATRRRGLQRLDQVLYISRHTQQAAWQANRWLPWVPAAVCHLGLAAETGTRKSGGTPLVEGEFALMIGRMASGERYKGHEEMIRVWPRLADVLPDLPLVVVGNGDDRARLEYLARELRADVRFVGAVDDAARDACLAACRAFCLPSRGEGFGLVYLEAMRQGKPVLAGSGDAGPEVVVDHVTGRTVDPTTEDELLGGLVEVLGPKAELMGQAGRERFQEEFSYQAFVERLAKHYRGLIEGPGRPAEASLRAT